jgi:hypothetical protein
LIMSPAARDILQWAAVFDLARRSGASRPLSALAIGILVAAKLITIRRQVLADAAARSLSG